MHSFESLKDNNAGKVESLVKPAESDVVFGRGRGCMNRNGNKRFRMIIDRHRQQYQSASIRDKTKVTKNVVKIINTIGGRFLEQNSSTKAFEEVPEKRAFDKVSHALRGTQKEKSSTSEPQSHEELLIRQQKIFCDLLVTDIREMDEEEAKFQLLARGF